MDIRDIVDNKEPIARFIRVSDWIRKKDNTITSQGWEPYQDNETSVLRIQGLSEPKIWELEQIITKKKHGRVDIIAEEVFNIRLKVVPDPNYEMNIPNHACVRDWPENVNERMAKADLLAAASSKVKTAP